MATQIKVEVMRFPPQFRAPRVEVPKLDVKPRSRPLAPAVLAPLPMPALVPMPGPRQVDVVPSQTAQTLLLGRIAESLDKLGKSIDDLKKLTLLSTLGAAAAQHRYLSGNDFATPIEAYYNKRNRHVAVAFQVTVASATAGATLIVGFDTGLYNRVAALPADVVGGATGNLLLAPNEKIFVQMSATDIRVTMSIADPLGVLNIVKDGEK